MDNKLISGDVVSSHMKQILKEEIEKLEKTLKLVVIQVGNDPASNVYVNNKKKACEEMNILFEHLKYDEVNEEDLINKIDELNEREDVTGILVQLPLPSYLDEKRIVERVSYKKDVDGLNSVNIGRLYNSKDAIIPCTAYGILKMFDYYNISLESKDVVIVGRSNLVGIPLFKLLLDKNCTVTMCHSKTKDLKKHTLNADIIIVAVGKKDFLTKDMIKDGVVLIDVGINRDDKKICGDISCECYEKSMMYTPVPKGVGKTTIVMLINNILECNKLQEKEKNI